MRRGLACRPPVDGSAVAHLDHGNRIADNMATSAELPSSTASRAGHATAGIVDVPPTTAWDTIGVPGAGQRRRH